MNFSLCPTWNSQGSVHLQVKSSPVSALQRVFHCKRFKRLCGSEEMQIVMSSTFNLDYASYFCAQISLYNLYMSIRENALKPDMSSGMRSENNNIFPHTYYGKFLNIQESWIQLLTLCHIYLSYFCGLVKVNFKHHDT